MPRTYSQLGLDRQLCFTLYAASRAVVRAYGPLLEKLGLTYPQYVTMLALWEAADQRLSIGDLGERLHLDSGTLTPMLKRLEALGHVRRERDTQDERRVLVTVTDQGMALRDDAADIPAALLELSGLDVQKASGLRAQLRQLTSELEAALGDEEWPPQPKPKA